MAIDRDRAVSHQEKRQTIWYRSFWAWSVTYYILAALTLIFSTLVAAKPKIISASPDFYDLIAWIVAILTGLNTLFQPLEKGGRFRRAWTLLSVALTRYRADTAYKLDQVLAAYEQGEAIIHETPAQQTPAQHPPEREFSQKV
jgi:hypothetical protein